MDLDKLIKKCKKGDPVYQSILYQKYKDTLFSISLKYSLTKEDAQDILQDSFLEIFKNIRRYKKI